MNPAIRFGWSTNCPFFGEFYVFSKVKAFSIVVLIFTVTILRCNKFIRCTVI